MKEKSHPSANGWLVESVDNNNENNIVETTALYKSERDRPLTFHWKTEVDFTRAIPVLLTSDREQNGALNSVLTEAVLAAEAGQWISYSRTKSFYSGLRRYHGTAYTYTTVLWAIEQALALELIEEDRAPKGRRGWQSRFKATPRLVEIWQDAKAGFRRPELIYLKNDDGDLIDYRDTDATRRMRRELAALNEYLGGIVFDINTADAEQAGHHIKLDGAYYLPTNFGLYRVFNRGSWSKGGRVYGWWQALKKTRRAGALIDGEAVLEPDFDSMHAAMLYARLGRELDFDPYSTGDFERSEGKLAFVIGINARSHVGAINSLAKKLDCDKGHAAAVYAAMRQRNKDLDDAGAFGSDQGAGLMRQDSEITIGALKALAKAGIPALPIHDSMLTPARHADQTAGEMRDSFARQFNGSIRCSVRVSANLVLHMPSPLSPPSSCPSPSSFLPLDLAALVEPSKAGSTLPNNVIEEHPENLGVSENGQMSMFGLLDEPGETPEHQAIAEIQKYEGGILPAPVARMLRDTRRRRGIKQADMARSLGISRPQLANAERQRFGLSREPAARLRQWVAGGIQAA